LLILVDLLDVKRVLLSLTRFFLFQGQAVFKTKFTFRPHSTDTLTHRKMTLSMADRSNKKQKVKVLAAVGADPETQKQVRGRICLPWKDPSCRQDC
jgi:hypothetical protein